jgi:hypothetical protein
LIRDLLNFDGDIDLFGFFDGFKNGPSLLDGFFNYGLLLFVPLSCLFLFLFLSISDLRYENEIIFDILNPVLRALLFKHQASWNLLYENEIIFDILNPVLRATPI